MATGPVAHHNELHRSQAPPPEQSQARHRFQSPQVARRETAFTHSIEFLCIADINKSKTSIKFVHPNTVYAAHRKSLHPRNMIPAGVTLPSASVTVTLSPTPTCIASASSTPSTILKSPAVNSRRVRLTCITPPIPGDGHPPSRDQCRATRRHLTASQTPATPDHQRKVLPH